MKTNPRLLTVTDTVTFMCTDDTATPSAAPPPSKRQVAKPFAVYVSMVDIPIICACQVTDP